MSAPATPPGDSIFSAERLPLTLAVGTVIALAAFNILAAIAALPEITADLGDVALLSWVITGFLLTSTLATMVAGPLIDALGVRTAFRLTIVVFVAGSVACAVAPSMVALVVARGVQGVGGGLAFTVATAAVGVGYPEALRARALASLSVTWGIMAFGGPSIAAVFVATTGWRAVFLVNVPIALLAAVLGWRRFPSRQQEAPARLRWDAPGILLLTAFTVVSLIGLSHISVATAVVVGVALLLGVAYWVYSGRASAPVLARRYFAHRPLGTINVAFAAAFGAAVGIDAYLPVYVRGGLGHSAGLAAFSVAFLTLGWSGASIVVSRLLDDVSSTTMARFGYAFLIPALIFGLLFYDSATPLPVVLAVAFVAGVGVGTLAISLLSLLQRLAGAGEMGRATAAHHYVRGVFQTYAAALMGAILILVVRNRLGDEEVVAQLLAGEATGGDQLTRSAVASGFRIAHGVALALASLGLVVALSLARAVRRVSTREGSVS